MTGRVVVLVGAVPPWDRAHHEALAHVAQLLRAVLSLRGRGTTL